MAKKRRGKYAQITFGLDENALSHEWKKRVGVELWKFTSRNFPLKRKLTGKDFYVDSDTLVNAIILTGTVPNAADIKGFNAPIDERVPAKTHPVNVYGKWRNVSTKTKVGRMGVYERPTEYYGGKKIELGYFGVKVGGGVTAYGLTADGNALPAYSYDAVTWLEEQQDEVKRILDECFSEVFRKARSVA